MLVFGVDIDCVVGHILEECLCIQAIWNLGSDYILVTSFMGQLLVVLRLYVCMFDE